MFLLKKIIAAFLMPVPIGLFLLLLSLVFLLKNSYKKAKIFLFFRDLECELETLAISMQLFIQILTKISEIQNVVKDNKDLLNIIAILSAYTKKELGFMCES